MSRITKTPSTIKLVCLMPVYDPNAQPDDMLEDIPLVVDSLDELRQAFSEAVIPSRALKYDKWDSVQKLSYSATLTVSGKLCKHDNAVYMGNSSACYIELVSGYDFDSDNQQVMYLDRYIFTLNALKHGVELIKKGAPFAVSNTIMLTPEYMMVLPTTFADYDLLSESQRRFTYSPSDQEFSVALTSFLRGFSSIVRDPFVNGELPSPEAIPSSYDVLKYAYDKTPDAIKTNIDPYLMETWERFIRKEDKK